MRYGVTGLKCSEILSDGVIQAGEIASVLARLVHGPDKLYSRAAFQLEHQEEARRCATTGTLRVLNGATRVPIDGLSEAQFSRGVVMLRDFAKYADEHGIPVVVQELADHDDGRHGHEMDHRGETSSQASPNDGEQPPLRERRIRAIEAAADSLGMARTAIPPGGKGQIKEKCLTARHLFTDSTFDKAWHHASTSKRVRVVDYAVYRGLVLK